MSSMIEVTNLGKKYIIAHSQPGRSNYRRFSEDLAAAFTWPLRALRAMRNGAPARRATTEDFWALRDVEFEVQQGEVVGIIGRNGAGKSTLLKILSRITEPTTGRIELDGRVASLLEVGTGFHPELTGRENIFLNGAILGMTKAEIKRKFDEIVAFAEVEKFLDTPVKRYTSGMYVRLAFAVAAHLEPEILIVDEVLAVGDAEFQKKCLGKMSDVARGGRTVLFVSHNMNAVESLCRKAMLLVNGRLDLYGDDVRQIITGYFQRTEAKNGLASVWKNRGSELDHFACKPLYFAITDANGIPLAAPARNDDQLLVVIRAEVRQPDPALNFGIALLNEDAHLLLWSMTTDQPEQRWPKLDVGEVEFRLRVAEAVSE